ncbi:ABC transporter ATP-binding protein [Mycolicibacterium komossense]|uniref:ABC transporter ATP-binding protein n=1 Tax=Mycolicibacterium komossense TaxID=1779 RepID=A0ABT3CFN4_9MYCO|nr:ABC transporter ATP-binding protein [Mycolicibacterium komossense]MCV7228183.1 ABC transporter ATP-binding protein [Mycolicibacterium komossense]
MSLRASRVSWRVRDKLIVDGVDISVATGSTVGLLGPNGSGKSSLLKLLAGLRATSSGVVQLDDLDVAALDRRRIARRLAVVDQDAATDQDPTVRDVVDLGRLPHRPAWAPMSVRDRKVVESAAVTTGVADLLNRRYSTLSGGERQRVQIARALAQEPTELLLDEPTNHLDIRHQLELLELVAAADTTTVMALHDLNLAAKYCQELVVLRCGRVHVAGPPSVVLTPAVIAEVYEVEATVVLKGDCPTITFGRPIPADQTRGNRI